MRPSPQLSVVVQCRTCGRVGYERGPCRHCRAYGHPWEPTDPVEIHAQGTVGKLTRELTRWKKEALELRRLYASARHEEDVLRKRVLRAERVRERLGRWARAVERARGELGPEATSL